MSNLDELNNGSMTLAINPPLEKQDICVADLSDFAFSALDPAIGSMIDHIIEKTSDLIFVWYLLILILRFVFYEEDTCKDAHDAIMPSKHGAISNEEKREDMIFNIGLFCAVIRLLYAKNVYKMNAIVESDASYETDIVLLLFVASKKKMF